MKRVNQILTITLMAFAISCGTQKMSTSSGLKSVNEGTDVILLAEAQPSTRAYGVGTHIQEATARRTAEANARAALAAAIQTMVTQGLNSYANSVSVQLEEALATDESSKMSESVSAISKECVTNTATIKMERYKNKSEQFVIYVCIEHRLDMKALAKEVSNQFGQKVPEEMKKRLAFEEFQFQKQMEKAFEEYTSVAKESV